MSEVKTGLGHQYKADEKAVNACKSNLEQAFTDIMFSGNEDVITLRCHIAKLIQLCDELSYSANEAYKIND